jgi:hypothetical protein
LTSNIWCNVQHIGRLRVVMSSCRHHSVSTLSTFDSSMDQHRVTSSNNTHIENPSESRSWRHLHQCILRLTTLDTLGYFESDPQSVSPPSQTIRHPNVHQFLEQHPHSEDNHCSSLSYTTSCVRRWNHGTIQSRQDAGTVEQLSNESPNLPYDWYK